MKCLCDLHPRFQQVRLYNNLRWLVRCRNCGSRKLLFGCKVQTHLFLLHCVRQVTNNARNHSAVVQTGRPGDCFGKKLCVCTCGLCSCICHDCGTCSNVMGARCGRYCCWSYAIRRWLFGWRQGWWLFRRRQVRWVRRRGRLLKRFVCRHVNYYGGATRRLPRLRQVLRRSVCQRWHSLGPQR